MFSYKSFSMWWILFSDVFTEALLVRKINPDAISANDEKASWLPELWVPINHYSIKSTANFIFCTWMVSKKLFYNNSLIIRAKWFTICISLVWWTNIYYIKSQPPDLNLTNTYFSNYFGPWINARDHAQPHLSTLLCSLLPVIAMRRNPVTSWPPLQYTPYPLHRWWCVRLVRISLLCA